MSATLSLSDEQPAILAEKPDVLAEALDRLTGAVAATAPSERQLVAVAVASSLDALTALVGRQAPPTHADSRDNERAPDAGTRVDAASGDTDTPARRKRFVDAATVAAEIGYSRDWVCEHAEELGGERVPEGRRQAKRRRAGAKPRPRWCFDLERACAAMERRSSEPSQGENTRQRAKSQASTKPRQAHRPKPRPNHDAGLRPKQRRIIS